MKKIRLIRTMVVEYEPAEECYDGCETIEQMAVLDADADDRELAFDSTNLVKDFVKWEVVEDDKVISSGESQLNWEGVNPDLFE